MPYARWVGYWEQHGFGRQPMSDLQLQFHQGTITGSGWDIIGPFKFDGEYGPNGAIALVKQYLGQHPVFYRGWYDGEGTISGEWTIPRDNRVVFADGQVFELFDEQGDSRGALRGNFQMRLDGGATATGEIQEFNMFERSQSMSSK